MSKWIVIHESAFPCRGTLKCKCDKCGNIKNARYEDYDCSGKYIMPNYCEDCGDKKENTIIYPTK